MDSYREFPDDASYASPADDEPVIERPPEIGFDERRMHVRAYNYWVSLLNGRPFPTIQDLDPANIDDFGPHSVLLDFTRDPSDPEIAWLGRALRVECALASNITRISQVPKRSLLSRLTDHYLQIIANSAPIGFEAEFVGQRGNPTMYRGILMPLSSDGTTIDFIYGVINWKELADSRTASGIASEVGQAIASPLQPAASPVWADGPNAYLEEVDAPAISAIESEDEPSLGLWPDRGDEGALPADAELADHLSRARDSADAARESDRRSRAALYRAIGDAYNFALAADREPEDYAELLADAGLKAQKRAPMTPLVKLVFGSDYDKTRLTEFAAVLTWAKAQGVAENGLPSVIEAFSGGIKAIVAAERQARRPQPKPDRWEQVRDALSRTQPLARVDVPVPADAGEWVLLLARREAAGDLAVVAAVADEALTKAAMRKHAA